MHYTHIYVNLCIHPSIYAVIHTSASIHAIHVIHPSISRINMSHMSSLRIVLRVIIWCFQYYIRYSYDCRYGYLIRVYFWKNENKYLQILKNYFVHTAVEKMIHCFTKPQVSVASAFVLLVIQNHSIDINMYIMYICGLLVYSFVSMVILMTMDCHHGLVHIIDLFCSAFSDIAKHPKRNTVPMPLRTC